MSHVVTSVDDLRAIVGHPNAAVANKVRDHLSSIEQLWLSHASLGFVATMDARGHVDVSPKGDPPGFVHIIDERTIAIPERPGTKRVDGYLNVLECPCVGTVFVIPGRADTLRINGNARIMADADYFDDMVVQASARSWRWRSPSRKCSSTAPRPSCGPTPGSRRVGTRPRCRASLSWSR